MIVFLSTNDPDVWERFLLEGADALAMLCRAENSEISNKDQQFQGLREHPGCIESSLWRVVARTNKKLVDSLPLNCLDPDRLFPSYQRARLDSCYEIIYLPDDFLPVLMENIDGG